MMLSVSEVTIAVKAPPMITPTAMSITLPRLMNSLNSPMNFFIRPPVAGTSDTPIIKQPGHKNTEKDRAAPARGGAQARHTAPTSVVATQARHPTGHRAAQARHPTHTAPAAHGRRPRCPWPPHKFERFTVFSATKMAAKTQ